MAHRMPAHPARWQVSPAHTALSANMDETVTPWKFSVEGESGLECDERIGAGRCWAGDRGRGEGDPAAVHGGVQTEDRPGADACKTPGTVGALLRREGLYSSHLTTWRAARERGKLAGAPTKPGPVRRVADPRDKRITELGRENTHWRKRAERAEALVELQKQIAALLGTPLTGEPL
jgi:transposase